MEIVLNAKNFTQVVTSNSTVIVDFWAPWCGPCRMLGPVLAEIANESSIVVGKVNVDEEEELSNQFGIRNIPTILIYKDGKMVNKAVGFMEKAEVLALIG